MDKISLYIKESYNELLNKVTWPTWPNLLESTKLVLVGSIIFALIILAMDAVSKQGTEFIYNFS